MALRDILDGLSEVEKQVNGIREVHARVPESLKSFPCVLNVPTSGEFDVSFGGNNRHLVNSTLIVDRAELPSAQNKILDLLEPLRDMIGSNTTLNGKCSSCRVLGYEDFGVHSFSGLDYFGVTLRIEVLE